MKALLDLTEQDFANMFAVNVTGVQNCFSASAKQLIKQGNCKPESPGKLIAASSIVGFKPFPLLSHYSATKWAVRGLTQAYAMELAEHNITCNNYAPGIVGTAMWDLIDEKLGEKSGAKKGETIKKYSEDLIALKRTSTPEDVAKLVSFLAGSDSDYGESAYFSPIGVRGLLLPTWGLAVYSSRLGFELFRPVTYLC